MPTRKSSGPGAALTLSGAKAGRPRTRPLVRHVIEADTHSFVGRLYDLSIIGMHFETYDELRQHLNCKYAFDVNWELTTLVERAGSLNAVANMMWPDPIPKTFKEFPISRYDWLRVTADTFLMRYISVVDCALILVNAVYELGLAPRKCSLENLKKGGVPTSVIQILEDALDDQGKLRAERNARFHHGAERAFTADATTFRMAAMAEHVGSGMRGTDRHGRKINVQRSFKEGLVELQQDFNKSCRQLTRRLSDLYDKLGEEFEARFVPLYKNSAYRYSGDAKKTAAELAG